MADLRNNFACVLFIQGRLTRDPELKYFQSGTPVLSFDIAHEKRVKSGGEWTSRTCFFKCKMFGKYAEAAADKIGKGSDVQIEGELDQEQWEDRNTGAKRSREIIIARTVRPMSWPDDQGETSRQSSRGRSAPPPRDDDPIPEDDIPF